VILHQKRETASTGRMRDMIKRRLKNLIVGTFIKTWKGGRRNAQRGGDYKRRGKILLVAGGQDWGEDHAIPREYV